jgi:hypothetical protein
MVKVLHPLQNFERRPFWNGWLKNMARGHHQWHDLPTKFYENPPHSSNVIGGDTQTDWQSHRQAYDLTSLLSFLTKVGYKYFHGDETKFVPTTQNRMHDSRLPPSADSARHEHSRHNTLVCISCYQFPSSELNFKFYCIAQTANLHSREWWEMAIMLLDICTQPDKARGQFRILHDE